MTRNDKVVKYVLEKINKEFKEDIELLVCYGSYVNGTENEMSDVDMYFIPRNNSGYELGETFILDGIGFDIFGMSWERVEGIADFKEHLSPLVGDVKIIYNHSKNSLENFEKLQDKLKNNLADYEFMQSCAILKIKNAVQIYNKMGQVSNIDEVRESAGYIQMAIADAIAYMNQTYFHKGLKKQYEDLVGIINKPSKLIELYNCIYVEEYGNNIREYCYEIIKSTIDFFELNKFIELKKDTVVICDSEFESANEIRRSIDYKEVALWYEELISTFNKIYVCANEGNYRFAFTTASMLQNSLKNESGLYLENVDLLSHYVFDDLQKLAVATKEIERTCVTLIEENKGQIRRVNSVEDLINK